MFWWQRYRYPGTLFVQLSGTQVCHLEPKTMHWYHQIHLPNLKYIWKMIAVHLTGRHCSVSSLYQFIDWMVFNAVFNNISVNSWQLVHLSMLSCSPFNQYFALILSKPLATFPQNHCRNNGQWWERSESCGNDYHQSSEKILYKLGVEPATSCSQVHHATDWAIGLVTLYQIILSYDNTEETTFQKHNGKWRKCWLPVFYPFPTMFSTLSSQKTRGPRWPWIAHLIFLRLL